MQNCCAKLTALSLDWNDMPDITVMNWILAALIVTVAYTVRGITGFGSGLIAIPPLVLMLPLVVVVPVIGLLDVSASLVHTWQHRRETTWRLIWPLLPWTFTGVVVALFLFRTVDPQWLVRTLGVFVLLFAAHNLLTPELRLPASRFWSLPAGLGGGIVGTLFGTGGPFYVIYLQVQRLPRGVFRATVASLFLVDGAARQVGYAVAGLYTVKMLMLVLAGIPLMLASMYIGGHIHTTISERGFRMAIGVLLVISGIALLIK